MFEIFKTVNPDTSSASSTSQFYVGNDGYLYALNAYIKGEIDVSSGKIGGWDILANRLEIDKTSTGGYRTGMQCLSDGTGTAFYAGCTTAAGGVIGGNSAFYVTQNGTLYSEKGIIGGWTITDSQIYKSTISNNVEYQALLYAPSSITPSSDKAFVVRTRTNNGSWEYPFAVRYDGSLIAEKF